MLAELGMVLGDPGHRLVHRTGHPGSSALGRRRGSSITTTQPKRAPALEPGSRARRQPGRPARRHRWHGLARCLVDLGEASAVGVLGVGVEALARVAECRARQAGRVAAVYLGTTAGLGGDQIQHVVLPAGIGEEPREVSHALEVARPRTVRPSNTTDQ
ncbi:MAG TPA: hypothetical protein VJ140_14375 [Actinomycetota bacterium]|nr:hypothetical protein [Actinomycetota bacterium]